MTQNVSHAQGELLAQVRPGVTTPVQLYKAGELRTEVTLIVAAVTAGGNVDIELYHDDSGNDVYDNTTIIANVQRASQGDPLFIQAQHPGSGIHIKPQGSLGIEISSANGATISVYGITETLAERIRGLE